MNKASIIRAWKDPEYRASLSEAERAELPDCPSGKPMTELDEGDLDGVAGGIVLTPPVSIVLNQCGPSFKYVCPPRSIVYGLCPPRTYQYVCPLTL